MNIALYNFRWMALNVFLALLPVIAAILFIRSKNRFARLFYGLIWLFFVPNTIYILTDLIHLPRQMLRVPSGVVPVLFVQYIVFEIIGTLSFLLAVYLMEHACSRFIKKYRIRSAHIIFAMNFVIAFGVTLGRFQRTNSWEVVTNFPRVVRDINNTITSLPMVLFIVMFGLSANIIYYLFRENIKKELRFILDRVSNK